VAIKGIYRGGGGGRATDLRKKKTSQTGKKKKKGYVEVVNENNPPYQTRFIASSKITISTLLITPSGVKRARRLRNLALRGKKYCRVVLLYEKDPKQERELVSVGRTSYTTPQKLPEKWTKKNKNEDLHFRRRAWQKDTPSPLGVRSPWGLGAVRTSKKFRKRHGLWEPITLKLGGRQEEGGNVSRIEILK